MGSLGRAWGPGARRRTVSRPNAGFPVPRSTWNTRTRAVAGAAGAAHPEGETPTRQASHPKAESEERGVTGGGPRGAGSTPYVAAERFAPHARPATQRRAVHPRTKESGQPARWQLALDADQSGTTPAGRRPERAGPRTNGRPAERPSAGAKPQLQRETETLGKSRNPHDASRRRVASQRGPPRGPAAEPGKSELEAGREALRRGAEQAGVGSRQSASYSQGSRRGGRAASCPRREPRRFAEHSRATGLGVAPCWRTGGGRRKAAAVRRPATERRNPAW